MEPNFSSYFTNITSLENPQKCISQFLKMAQTCPFDGKIEQAKGGNNIVAEGEAGAPNPYAHPKPHFIHKHT